MVIHIAIATTFRASTYQPYHSSSTLSREHNRISSIIDSSGCIRSFGPGRRGTFNHRFQHLCCHHARFALCTALVDDCLLEDGNILRSAFNAKISTSNHDTIAKLDNLLKRVSLEAAWLFNFCHNVRRECTG